MPKTELGGLLISQGLLTRKQLERALERQRSFGGRIGTCLLEIGAISEDKLLGVLAEQLNVPMAPSQVLRDVPAEIIGLLPRSTALGCSAVPFGQAGGRIDVALLDPGNLALEDELSFSMGRRIRPHIANELRIVEALHRFYGGDVALRFRSLLEREIGDSKPTEPTSAPQTTPSSPSPVPAYLRPGSESSGSRTSRKSVSAPPKFDKQAISLTAAERAALATTREEIRPVPEPKTAPRQLTEDSHEVYGQHLSSAETASEIGTSLIQILARQFSRVLLFRVSSGNEDVNGWMSHGPNLDLEWFRHYSVGLHHATVFRELSEGMPVFAGRLEPTPAHRALARCWMGAIDRGCLFLPISVRGKLVCVAYADRGDDGVEDVDLDFLRRVAQKTALAFERCILRRKLQAT